MADLVFTAGLDDREFRAGASRIEHRSSELSHAYGREFTRMAVRTVGLVGVVRFLTSSIESAGKVNERSAATVEAVSKSWDRVKESVGEAALTFTERMIPGLTGTTDALVRLHQAEAAFNRSMQRSSKAHELDDLLSSLRERHLSAIGDELGAKREAKNREERHIRDQIVDFMELGLDTRQLRRALEIFHADPLTGAKRESRSAPPGIISALTRSQIMEGQHEQTDLARKSEGHLREIKRLIAQPRPGAQYQP